jgi:spermidine synthase
VLLFFSPRHGYDSFAQRVLGELGISALVMLVPTTLLGAAFPVACHLYASGIRETGRTVGRLYVFNTLGCVAGALLTGFYLVRALGTQWSLTAASFLMVASAGALFTWAPGARAGLVRRAAPAGAFAAVALAVWAATPADYLARFFVRNQYLLVSKPDAKVSLLGFGEGVEGVVVVCEFEGGNRTIATGSTDVAGTGYILRTTQKLQAHVPMLIHPNPKDVCQVGFGSGETAYLFTTYGLDRFDCVEISQAVVDMAAAYFTDINHGAARSPACHLVVMDGAAYLKYTPQRYDVIANDSIWPHLAGNSALYTVEYFRDGREHLKPGGIMTSWLPLEMPVSDFRSLLASFHAVFPHVYLWTALQPDNKHALLVGSLEPLQVDTARFVERFERYAREDLKLLYLSDPAAFLACHLATIEGHPLDLATAPLNTVDRPVLQYLGSSPDLFRAATRGGLIADCLRFLAQHRDSVLNHVANTHGLEAQGALLGRVRAMDEATTHVLRAMVSRWDDPAGSAAEYREAMRLAPEHPYFLVASRVGADRGAKYLADLPKLDLATVKEQARSAFGEGAYAEARALYAEWTRREPTSAAAYAGLGLACVNIGRLAEAQEALTRAASLDPSLADAHLGLGAIYMRSGRLPAAIERLQTAVKLEPGSANAHAQLGAAYALSARRSEAEAELERAIELDPRLANAHGNLGTLLLQDGDAAGAVQHLEKFVELRPDSAQGHRSLGEAYAKAGNAEMAERHLRRAAELERTGPQGAPQGAARQE